MVNRTVVLLVLELFLLVYERSLVLRLLMIWIVWIDQLVVVADDCSGVNTYTGLCPHCCHSSQRAALHYDPERSALMMVLDMLHLLQFGRLIIIDGLKIVRIIAYLTGSCGN